MLLYLINNKAAVFLFIWFSIFCSCCCHSFKCVTVYILLFFLLFAKKENDVSDVSYLCLELMYQRCFISLSSI